MTERFEIDIEGTTQENGLFKGDEFVCYADDVETIIEKLNELNDENEELKERISELDEMCTKLQKENDVLKQQLKTKYIVNKQYEEKIRLEKENKKLEEENKRMTNKLNEIALEFLNHNMVSMEKATEISEMCYHDFLKYRAENGNPMELQL